MKIKAVCEYNDQGYLIYAANYVGAYVRGATENEALSKFSGEVRSYLRWCGVCEPPKEDAEVEIVQRKESDLQICDADSDILFDAERTPLSEAEYARLKLLVLKSARDFRKLYASIPNPDISGRAPRRTFYGAVPRTPREMYEHTNSVTSYYTGAFGLETENVADIYANRMQALAELETLPDFLSEKVYIAPDGESWTMRKVLRRFIWHDRIHAKAMWRTAVALWGSEIKNPFYFI
ncbi:MAG: hypothetical protein PUF80_09440 [Firmicutes bacterium]|nr:hypothetical protein [Bacillota bacterium]